MHASRPRSRWRWLVRVAVLVVVLALGAIVVTAARGVYDVSPYPRDAASAPRWTMPCFHATSQYNHEPQCARVRGRVVWREQSDPDGDGDRHIVVLSRMRLRVVKLRPTRCCPVSARRSRRSASPRSARAASARSSPRRSGADPALRPLGPEQDAAGHGRPAAAALRVDPHDDADRAPLGQRGPHGTPTRSPEHRLQARLDARLQPVAASFMAQQVLRPAGRAARRASSPCRRPWPCRPRRT